MKAITVRLPWAAAVAAGHKKVENRGRPTAYRGPVAIHSARAHDPNGDIDPRILRLWGPHPRLGWAAGAVLAVAELVDCHPDMGDPSCCTPWGDRWYSTRDWAWHLVLADIRRLPEPVYVRGQQAVPWTLPPDVAAQVATQLEEAGRCS